MRLRRKIKNVARAFKQMWGAQETKATMWDEEYASGRWDHLEHTRGGTLYECIERHCRNGSVLDLGCGLGNTGNEMNNDRYGAYVGVDISEVAVGKAALRSAQIGRAAKNQFLAGDIASFAPAGKHDVILFRESIYYVPSLRIKAVLNRYRAFLHERGVFIVEVSTQGTKRADKIRALITEHFEVVEEFSSPESAGFILVFR